MKLSHVSIRTMLVDAEIEFFEKYAGLKVVESFKVGENRIFFLEDDHLENSTKIEIIETPMITKVNNDTLTLGFSTENIEEKRAELISSNIEAKPVVSPIEGVEFFYVYSPSGAKIQFICKEN